tara:strand:+ start:737 stop:2002 length:1266 start_codon:yes stop_codon:yes gene_type:complete
MNYISVCSGIEAATVAWKNLGWNPLGFSEVDKFPSAVLKHHYPNVPNLGDMTNYKEWNINEPVDLIIGGTPCQSFSISGLRKGLEDPRGNLALTYIGLLDHFKPKYFIWENVPGVLSSNKGKDFSSFIRAIQEIRYGFAYRTLDAQYFGVPQRRKRVFVVGCSSGDWRSAAEILFESESLSRDTEESRQKGKDTTKETRGSSTTDNRWPARISNTLDARYGDKMGLEDQHINSDCPRFVPVSIQGNLIGRSEKAGPNGVGASEDNTMYTLTKTDVHAVVYEARAKDARYRDTEQTSPTMKARWENMTDTPIVYEAQEPKIFQQNQRDEVRYIGEDGSISGSLSADSGARQTNYVHQKSVIRRLTPVECERLQGFPCGYTEIPYNNRPHTPDGHRYKALGNSMAVPVVKWIGERVNGINNRC